jgi:hypothetical protein
MAISREDDPWEFPGPKKREWQIAILKKAIGPGTNPMVIAKRIELSIIPHWPEMSRGNAILRSIVRLRLTQSDLSDSEPRGYPLDWNR